MDDVTATNSKSDIPASCRLLELPAEIRQYIYELVFSPKAGGVTLGPLGKGRETHLKQLPFLQTCRQIRQEAQSIPFSSIFVYVGGHDLVMRDFILDSSIGRLESISDLTLNVSSYDEALGLLLLTLTCMPNLTRLGMIMSEPWDDVVHEYHHGGSKVIRAAISKHEHIEHLDYGNQYAMAESTEMRAVNQEVMTMVREHREKRRLSTRGST